MESHNHSDDSRGDVTCSSQMVFHDGHCEMILVEHWIAKTLIEFVLSALAFFLLALIYEYLRYVRECVYKDATVNVPNTIVVRKRIVPEQCIVPKAKEVCPNKEPKLPYYRRLLNVPHFIKTLLHTTQVLISYILMLVFMTFNYWLCLAIIVGYGLGYFCFGWIKRSSFNTDCCY